VPVQLNEGSAMSLRTLYREEFKAATRGRFAALGAGVVLLLIGGLATVSSQETWKLLGDLAARDGVTMFPSSHDAQEVRSWCTEISVIAKGRLVFTGPTNELGDDLDSFEENLIGLLTRAAA